MSLRNTIQAHQALSLPQQQALMAPRTPSGKWFPGWRPKCQQTRVPCKQGYTVPRPYGFQCPSCQDMQGFDGQRLIESPLNHHPDAPQ